MVQLLPMKSYALIAVHTYLVAKLGPEIGVVGAQDGAHLFAEAAAATNAGLGMGTH